LGVFSLLHKTGRLVPRALVLAALVLAASVALVVPSRASAVIGNCTRDAAWGAPDTTFAAQVVTLVNQHRQAMGLSTLGVSPTLTASAQWKSAHMAYYQYMQHDDPAPPVARTVSDRLAACGYPTVNIGWGENIAYGYQTPQDVMNAWLNSAGHKANIENSSFRAIGVGAVRGANGYWYWTQDFGTLLDSGSTQPPAPGPVAPGVTISSGPGASTTSTLATFAFTTSGSPTSVTCSLDGGAAAACTSPRSYSGLAVGSHRFVVTAANGAGSSSATYTWTIASSVTAAPTVRFTSLPVAHAWNSTFAWATTGTVTSTTCTLDSRLPVSCKSPTTYYFLPTGQHTFTVRVANSLGSSSTTYSWVQ
jgi:uncharacterized protein YkwD